MTKIRIGTRYTIGLHSGVPLTIEYKDWGNKSLDYFVFTPKAMAHSYYREGATTEVEGDVKIYILQSEYREWFGENDGGDREITIHDKWANKDGKLISPGTPGGMYTSRFTWPTRAEWDKVFDGFYSGRLRDGVMETKVSSCRCKDE